MKNLFLIALFAIKVISLTAKEIVVENPPFSVASHSNLIINKVVINDTATSLYMSENESIDKLEVPDSIKKWFQMEIASMNESQNQGSESFFSSGIARLRGYIRNYGPSLNFSTGIIYLRDVITSEEFPVVANVHQDGRFEADFPLKHPVSSFIHFGDRARFPFYLEPNRYLIMVVDGTNFSDANTTYSGPLSKINTDLLRFAPETYNSEAFYTSIKTLTPQEFLANEKVILEKNKSRLKAYVQEYAIDTMASTILSGKILLHYANQCFNYQMYRTGFLSQDTGNLVLKMPLPEDYYDFLQQIPMDDPNLLVNDEFVEFINRFEYCTPFAEAYQVMASINKIPQPEKTFFEYLNEMNVELTKEEKELMEWRKDLSSRKVVITIDNLDEYDRKNEQEKAMIRKYDTYHKEYTKRYIDTLPPRKINSLGDAELLKWGIRDSMLIHVLNLSPNSLVYESIKLRSLSSCFKNMTDKQDARIFLTGLEKGIDHPFLTAEAEQIYNRYFSEMKQAYTLPEGKATDIFRKIIDPFKGKIIIVDFWATSCGPCISAIKKMKNTRTEYKNKPDFEFVFITQESLSPLNAYNKFIEEHELSNTYRLSIDDYNYMRQLFKFNGIPRYVVIDKEGRVASDNFFIYSFEREIKKLFGEQSN